ncbi:MAG: S1C family serine protease [Maioricimonas sp. JB045]
MMNRSRFTPVRFALPALRAATLLAATLLASARPAEAREIIELRTGHSLTGEVLKETDRELYIDIGVDVVRVPTEQIRQRRDAESKTATPSLSGSAEDVFLTAELPVRSVKDLAARFGEGVVLVETPSGLGSGFIINNRGYCITNYHVVEQETRVSVTIFHRTGMGDFIRKRIENVRILALNPFFDLALLQIPKPDDFEFTPVYLAPSFELQEGDEVFAIGNPLGLERSVSQGIVSTRNRNFEGVVYIQTTAEINPGNSGGPLFNNRGEVVGVTNINLVGGEGLGFAIPITYVKHFLRNRDAFAFDEKNPNTGYRYLDAPRRRAPASN